MMQVKTNMVKMRLSRKPASPSQNQVSATPQVEQLNSRLLPEVFANFEPDDPIRVLDLGPGQADTLNFLSQFSAKVTFLDVRDLDWPEADEELTPAQGISICQQTINLPAHSRFDVVLFWDALHQLNTPLLEGLSAKLFDHTHKRTLGFGFGFLQSDRLHKGADYSLIDQQKIKVRLHNDGQSFTAHSQQQLTEHFVCMHIAKATLLQEGKLELLFERY